jgi:hypothetical protein
MNNSEETKSSSTEPSVALANLPFQFETDLATVRKDVIAQLTLLVSAREYVFWPLKSTDDEDETLDSLFELPMIYIFGKHGNARGYRATRIFMEEGTIVVEGADDDSPSDKDTIVLDWLETDTVVTLLVMILKGEFAN